jgi:hypothetical protein
MRAMTIAFPASIVLSLAAAGQEQTRDSLGRAPPPPVASPGGAAAPQAPVGHRQPTEKSLPPAVRQEESSRRQADPLGPIPSICRNC